MKSFILFLFFSFILVGSASAGICTAHIERTCKPNTVCRPSETHTLLKNSADECMSHAKSLCTVYLVDSITSKQVRANFDGQPVASGQNLCK